MPKNTAVTGSSTPSIAVGVEPMYWIASVVHINEMTVGKMDNARMLPHNHQRSVGGIVSTPLVNDRIANMIQPTIRTYMVTLMVAIFFIRDLLTKTI